MSKTKFTKGEWVVRASGEFDDEDNFIVSMDSHIKDNSDYMAKHRVVIDGSWGGDDEAIANAHLIAAAPEMYDLLTSIENDADQVPAWLWDKIQLTLAKARGEK